MFRYIVRRMIIAVPMLLISSILVFFILRNTFDPLGGAALNPRIRPEDIARVRHAAGLDKSQPEQYWLWLKSFVRGDWGSSLLSNRPVFKDIKDALANTLVLGTIATVFSLLVGAGIGVYWIFDKLNLIPEDPDKIITLSLTSRELDGRPRQ